MSTEIGKIQAHVQAASEEQEKTPLGQKIDAFGELLAKVNEACEKNIVRVPMQPGDVLLCDNYRVLHGRDVFEGDRLHAVSWFGDGSTKADGPATAKSGLEGFINKVVVGE